MSKKKKERASQVNSGKKHYTGKGAGKSVRKSRGNKRGPHINKYEGKRGQ